MADTQATTTVIAPGTVVSGELRGEESVSVHGRINGRVQLTETLTIESDGVVEADLEVKTLVVAGVLVGNVIATDSVRLLEKARVVGNLSAPRIAIDGGAAYRGRVEMGEAAPVARTARATATRDSATPAAAPAKAPPRLAPPPRQGSVAATGSPAPLRAPAPPAAPRVATPAPALARPETAAGGASATPAWAQRKVRRR